MNHKQALSDYEELVSIANGQPYDAGEILEGIASKMLRRPGAKHATEHLCHLIELFFERGGPRGAAVRGIPEADEIFVRHQLMSGDEDGE